MMAGPQFRLIDQFFRARTVILAFVLAASGTFVQIAPGHAPARAAAASSNQRDIGLYRHLGTWIDIYDARPYDHPIEAIRKMERKGVRTLFLETSNYHWPTAVHRPNAASRLIEGAHRKGIRVVAWYLPSFASLEKDFRRAKAAISFRTTNGDRFDSFALDIEATVVEDTERRNRRMERLSRQIRDAVGPDYAMGAIVPEAKALYWPNFPYRTVMRYFDAFLPMAYFTFRTQGADGVHRFISSNVRAIRDETGDRDIPIHVIGGIAEDASARETEAFVRAAIDRKAIGGSLYDFPTTRRKQWSSLAGLND